MNNEWNLPGSLFVGTACAIMDSDSMHELVFNDEKRSKGINDSYIISSEGHEPPICRSLQ